MQYSRDTITNPPGKLSEKFSLDLFETHRQLAAFNRHRLNPLVPIEDWREQVRAEMKAHIAEVEMLQTERTKIADLAAAAPTNPNEFMKWFEELKNSGPGQNDPLFDWLAESATRDQMTWFIRQEVVGEAGFEDLTALTQVKMPTRAKLELARNYWDEMGRGNEKGMHGPMLTKVAEELNIQPPTIEESMPEALALGNIMVGMASNRRYAYHSLGALGVIELTAPSRAAKVYAGLKRLGLSPEAQRYYLIHSTLDIKHSETWNQEVLAPLISEDPKVALPIAEGALMRLNAGARCFEKYRAVLWN
ncbi:MAG: iron-containing redox enzyme family protein [Bdellovibrionota bacterium]